MERELKMTGEESVIVWAAENLSTLKRLFKDYRGFSGDTEDVEDEEMCVFDKFVFFMFEKGQDVVHMNSNEEMWSGTQD
ncbi:hypothetical protein CMO96_00310 [Candidatus Woesebacteria bacterium]|nr:hypothetical protein [Candidatus Woesebacteria bacterium]